MSSIFVTPEGDKAVDDFVDHCTRLGEAQGVKINTTVVCAQSSEGTSVVVVGCDCQRCKLQIAYSVAKSLGLVEVAQFITDVDQPADPGRPH